MADRMTEHRFSLMVEKVSDYAIFLLDPAGTIQTWNPAAKVMKGYSASEAIGCNVAMLYTDEDQRSNHPQHNLAHALQHGTFQEQRWRKRKDGLLFWAMVEIIALRDEGGQLTGFCKLTRDMTEMRQLEENLRQEKERAEVTLAAIGDGVISVSNEHRVVFLNVQAQQLTGWSQDEARGRPIREVFDIVPVAEYKLEESGLVEADPSGICRRTTQVLRARDGSRSVIETVKSDIPASGEDSRGAVMVFRDVIDSRRMEVALRDADRRKDEFLAMLAHELRNPLAPVSAAAELLALGRLSPERASNASNIIIRQVKHITELVDDLLDVSRVSWGLITLNAVSLDMKCMVANAVEQIRPLIESRKHTLSIKMSPANAYVKGDQKRLVQVVANILNNAAKYTPANGAIDVEMAVRDDKVWIDISDNGMGIAPQIQPVIFELFAQAQRSSDRSAGGLGIGLALVRSLVQLHGGSVTCYSKGVGQGSRFSICLPSLKSDEVLPERRKSSRLEGVSPVIPDQPVSVLIVDDNVDAAEMLQLFLFTSGYTVAVAHSGEGALDVVRRAVPDICILDIGLPDRSGYDVAVQIRSFASPPPMLIALTGFGAARDRSKADAAGFDHYFVKPADLNELISTLAAVNPRTPAP